MCERFTAALLLLITALPSAQAADADLDCVILPDEHVELSSPVPGVIEAVLVGRSARVARGQVLARLESSVELATVELADARAQTNAEAQLRRVELEYDAQHRDRLTALHTRQVVSSQNREDAERAAAVARLRLRLAEDRRREAQLERRRAEAVLALKTLRSPIDGVVVERMRTVGEYVEDRPILRIARLDPLRVEVIAPLGLFGTVQTGMHVAVRPETDPDNERVATVTAVDAVADPGSGTFGIELELPNPELTLPAGIKCKGRLLQSMVEAEAPQELPSVGTPTTDGESTGPQPVESAVENAHQAVTAPVRTSQLSSWDVPSACLLSGLLHEESAALALARAADRPGVRGAVREVPAERVVNYMVLTAAVQESPTRAALMGRLRTAGITDFAVLSRGEHAGQVSLGVYKGPRSAERRRASVAALGIETRVVPRTRSASAWRVALELAAGIDAAQLRAELADVAGTAGLEPRTCEPLQTAAR